jgi:hypothetical protein
LNGPYLVNIITLFLIEPLIIYLNFCSEKMEQLFLLVLLVSLGSVLSYPQTLETDEEDLGKILKGITTDLNE